MEKNSKENEMGCRFHRILMFFVPLLYALETRFLKRSKLGAIVWATEFLLPTIIALWLVKYNFAEWYYWIVSILSVYNLYEIGYIQNDCETIKREQKPTLRVSTKELLFYEKWKYSIYGLRFLLGLLGSVFFLYHGSNFSHILIFWLIVPIYAIYNYLRGRVNLYLIFILTSYRYCMPLILVCDIAKSENMEIILAVLVVYPVLKLIEICAGGKSLPQEKWTKIFMANYESRFVFRIKYYFCLSILFVVFQLVGNANLFWLLPVYFLLLRGCQWKMPKLGAR